MYWWYYLLALSLSLPLTPQACNYRIVFSFETAHRCKSLVVCHYSLSKDECLEILHPWKHYIFFEVHRIYNSIIPVLIRKEGMLVIEGAGCWCSLGDFGLWIVFYKILMHDGYWKFAWEVPSIWRIFSAVMRTGWIINFDMFLDGLIFSTSRNPSRITTPLFTLRGFHTELLEEKTCKLERNFLLHQGGNNSGNFYDVYMIAHPHFRLIEVLQYVVIDILFYSMAWYETAPFCCRFSNLESTI